MTRDELIKNLYINTQDELHQIYEKLFCAVLIQEGPITAARVLRKYNEWKDLLKGDKP